MSYSLPLKKDFKVKELTQKDVEFTNAYQKNLKNKATEKKYFFIKNIINSKVKSLNNKVKSLNEDKNKATSNLVFHDYADFLLTNYNEYKGAKQFIFNEKVIILDPTKKINANIENFYKKYKKAKATLSKVDDFLSQTTDELNYFYSLKNIINFYNEDDFISLIEEFESRGLIKKHTPKKKTINVAYKPYYIQVDDIKIGFGKNAIQNNELTFKLAKKDVMFLHVKNTHGSHVVIFSSSPSKKLLEIAGTICLITSNLTSGEIIYTQIKNLKKTSQLGKVILNKYESFYLKEIDDSYIQIILDAIRFK